MRQLTPNPVPHHQDAQLLHTSCVYGDIADRVEKAGPQEGNKRQISRLRPEDVGGHAGQTGRRPAACEEPPLEAVAQGVLEERPDLARKASWVRE